MLTTLSTFGVPFADFSEAVFMSQLDFDLQLAGLISPDFEPVSPNQRCHKFDQGVGIVVRVLGSDGTAINIRPASLLSILLVKPGGQRIAVPATFLTNGLDGKMYFATTATLPQNTGLDQAGLWQVQGKITISGNTQFTEWGCFLAAPNLGE